MQENANYNVVMTTCSGIENAERIARELVNNHLAACVQILPGVRSFFHWEGMVDTATECLVLIKTVNHNYPDIELKIRELHEYDLPEIIAIPVSGGFSDYLDWINDNSKP